ncbi:MAG: Ig-like domain-containing protein [Chloroflexi bacterium]|nr:Ig-like domain-containing protein [Chloroflexota bacterium]
MNHNSYYSKFLQRDELLKWINKTWRVLLIFVFVFSLLQINSPQSALAQIVPVITTGGSLTAFSSPAGGISAEQSYTVTGSGLTEVLLITAPTDFELSLTSGEGFGAQLSLTPDGDGVVPETTIYVRMKPAAAMDYSAAITHTSGDTVPVELPVSGSSVPVIQVNSTMTEFSTLAGVYSVEQTYTVSALNLTGDLLIASPAGFEISLASGSGFGSQLTLTPDANGVISETTVSVRFFSSEAGSISGNIVHSSDAAAPVELAVSGTASINQPPVINEGSSITIDMSEDGSPNPFSLTLNATDDDEDTLTWSILIPASQGTASASGIGYTQIIDYAPTSNYFGSDSFTVQVSDGIDTDAITVNVNVSPVNDAPTGTDQSVSTPANTPLDITLTGSDVESDPLTFAVATQPAHGVLSGTLPNLIYTPATNYTGTDSFTFTVSDSLLTSVPATVSIECQDVTSPTVTINQGSSQADPAYGASISFDVVFSEKVTGFEPADVQIAGTAPGTLTAAITGSGNIYKVAVSGMSSTGTVIASIPAGAAQDTSGNPSEASTSTDNTVTYAKVFIPGRPVINKYSTPALYRVINTLYPTFKWGASTPPATYYRLQVSTNSSFTRIVLDQPDIYGTTFTTATALSPGVKYFWRVRGYNPAGTAGAWSTVPYFETFLAIPTLSSPAEGELLKTDRPTFNWGNVDGATSYKIQVSTNRLFSTYLVDQIVTESQYTPGFDLPQNRLLYWRVRAKSTNVHSNWTSAHSFKTGNPPSVPTLVKPANAVFTTNYKPLLDWNNSTLASGVIFDYYQLQVATDKSFTTLVIEETISGITNSRFKPVDDLAANTKYFWRVRSFSKAGHFSAWSNGWSFKTAPLPPVLTHPKEGGSAASLKPVFEWLDVPGALSYTIQVSTSSTFSSILFTKTLTANEFTSQVTLPAKRTIYWRVRTNGTYGSSLWSKSYFKTH